MQRYLVRAAVIIAIVIAAVIISQYILLLQEKKPETIEYGASFNTVYAHELGLDVREVYKAMLDDLGVERVRLAAHWTTVEPVDDVFVFDELDYQVDEAERRGVDVILAVGRRLPRWPECHVPAWARELPWEQQKEEIREYIERVIERYKDRESIVYWQVENEPFLTVFAKEHCGELDVSFLEEEVALVQSLDGTRPILLTDSGNLGTWYGAYSRGDVFGTSVYVYLWNPDIGAFRTILPPITYRAKERVMELFFGRKTTLLIELSAEPWLLYPITQTPLEIQLERMNVDKFKEVLEYARDTHLTPQYLWGVEWWYFLKEMGDPSMWEYAKTLFH